MPEKESRAVAIARALLSRTEDALLSDDFDAFLACAALPYCIETFEGREVVRTVEELRAGFKRAVTFNTAGNITGLQRDLISADFTSPSASEIKFTYVTRRLSGHMLAEEAYPSIAIARQVGEDWKIFSSQHAVSISPEVRHSPAGPRCPEPIPKKAP